MSRTIRARVKDGVLHPTEKLDLPENQEVTLTILTITSVPDAEAFQSAAGAWKGTIDAEELIRNIYADRLVTTRPAPQL